jgi:hypothetical protein
MNYTQNIVSNITLSTHELYTKYRKWLKRLTHK